MIEAIATWKNIVGTEFGVVRVKAVLGFGERLEWVVTEVYSTDKSDLANALSAISIVDREKLHLVSIGESFRITEKQQVQISGILFPVCRDWFLDNL